MRDLPYKGTDMLERALLWAISRHAGQKDKGGMPYIAHVCAVVAGVNEKAEKTVAALHDILEDTDTTLMELRDEFPTRIVMSVVALTKQRDEDYETYLARRRRPYRPQGEARGPARQHEIRPPEPRADQGGL